MATLHVREFPDPTYEELRARALRKRTSISAEAIRLIERGLRTDNPRIAELLNEVETRRPRARPGTPGAAELIRQDRDAH